MTRNISSTVRFNNMCYHTVHTGCGWGIKLSAFVVECYGTNYQAHKRVAIAVLKVHATFWESTFSGSHFHKSCHTGNTCMTGFVRYYVGGFFFCEYYYLVAWSTASLTNELESLLLSGCHAAKNSNFV